LTAPAAIEPVLQTEHVFDYHSLLKSPVPIGKAQYGTRVFYEALGGRLSGPRLSGEVLGGGGDWALIGDDGWTRIDARGQCRTDDGAVLYFAYRGLVEPGQAVIDALSGGGETGFDDQYWRVMIEIETPDERYRWLTQSALVGRGRVCRGPGVAYQVYRVG
jgi:hypothetical protein